MEPAPWWCASLPPRQTASLCQSQNGDGQSYTIVEEYDEQGRLTWRKDARGYMSELASVASGLYAVAIPGEPATFPAEATAEAARSAGIEAEIASDVNAAIRTITATHPDARIVICGSLYLAGSVLRENA